MSLMKEIPQDRVKIEYNKSYKTMYFMFFVLVVFFSTIFISINPILLILVCALSLLPFIVVMSSYIVVDKNKNFIEKHFLNKNTSITYKDMSYAEIEKKDNENILIINMKASDKAIRVNLSTHRNTEHLLKALRLNQKLKK